MLEGAQLGVNRLGCLRSIVFSPIPGVICLPLPWKHVYARTRIGSAAEAECEIHVTIISGSHWEPQITDSGSGGSTHRLTKLVLRFLASETDPGFDQIIAPGSGIWITRIPTGSEPEMVLNMRFERFRSQELLLNGSDLGNRGSGTGVNPTGYPIRVLVFHGGVPPPSVV
jgi:hypothetical protein